MSDIYDDPKFREFVDDVRENLAPKIKDAHVTVSFIPKTGEEVDVKFAVELGLSIMYDKPIFAAVRPGTHISKKMALVVDRFIEFDPADLDKAGESLISAIQEFREEHEDVGPND